MGERLRVKIIIAIVSLMTLFVISGCGSDASSTNSPQSQDSNGSQPTSSPPIVGDAMTFATPGMTFNFGESGKQPAGKLAWTFEKNKFDQGYYSSIHSNTVISNDIVYYSLAGASGNKVSGMANGTLFALNYQTGQEKWNAPFSFSKLIASNDIVIGIGPSSSNGATFLNVLDAKDGKVKWAIDLPGGVNSPPILSDGKILLAESSQKSSYSSTSTNQLKDNIVSYDASSGQEKWRFPSNPLTSATVENGPVAANGLVYFIGQNNNQPFGIFDMIYAVDTNSGQEKWTWKPDNRNNMTAPVVVDGVIYVAAMEAYNKSDSNAPKDPKYFLYALDAQTGQEKWNTKTDFKGIPFVSADKDNVFVLNGGRDDYRGPDFSEPLVAFDSKSGKQKWNYTVNYVYAGMGKFEASLPIPAVANGMVYLTTTGEVKDQPFNDSVVIGLDSATGTEKFRYKHQYLPNGVTNDYTHYQAAGADVFNKYNDGNFFIRRPIYYNGMLFVTDGLGRLYGVQ